MSSIRLLGGMLLAACVGCAQDSKVVIQAMYAATFAALHDAKTKEDIAKMVDAFDAPEWVSNLPNGQTMTRAEAVRMLESVLSIAPAERPTPKMDVIFSNETKWNVTMLYWVYNGPEGNLTGSIARDTFVRTAQGWRRVRHEKFFPDRPLVVNGKPVIAPPY